jgi:putative flippase GtrA
MNEGYFKSRLLGYVKFGFAGGVVALTHVAFVFVLTDILGFWYLTASVVSYTCAIVLNFLLQKFFVSNVAHTRSAHTQFLYYVISSLVLLALNTLLMYISVSVLQVHYIVAQIGILLLLSIVTYRLNHNFIFR